ncbi:hypothetical protein BH18VER2_BH18VER2_10920 [soil metagenome]
MKNPILKIALATLAIASSAYAAQPKLFCTAAKKEINACCCEMKDGKSLCKLTGKTFEKCCCITK